MSDFLPMDLVFFHSRSAPCLVGREDSRSGTRERWQERENICIDKVTDLWLITRRSLSEEANAHAEHNPSDQTGFK